MEENFTQDEFEEFLQEQVRNHRMYPSDAVWRNINKNLHGDKKWPALTIAAFVIFSATIAISVYFTPKPNIFSVKPVETNSYTQPGSQNTVLNKLTSAFPSLKHKPVTASTPSELKAEKVPAPVHNFQHSAKDFNGRIASVDESPAKKIAVNATLNSSSQNLAHHRINVADDLVKSAKTSLNSASTTIANSSVLPPAANVFIKKNLEPGDKNSIAEKDQNDKNMVDGFLNEHKNDLTLYTKSKVRGVKNKLTFQVYIAPSKSYRKLLEDMSILKATNTGAPVGLNYVTDVNSVVRHRPGTGIEAGFSLMYNLSQKFRIKSGFQFNMRQYSIEAYRSNTELASITLVGNNGLDTVNSIAMYRNSNGYYSTELVNRYYQLAMPIGVEWEILGNKRIQFVVATSIQPTYLLNRNAYMLSTNFKNYTENPDMVRKWNINSNIETFISVKSGDFKWQIGPQLRYQPYSTFIRQYPIKEHLMDYGLKVGVSKTFR